MEIKDIQKRINQTKKQEGIISFLFVLAGIFLAAVCCRAGESHCVMAIIFSLFGTVVNVIGFYASKIRLVMERKALVDYIGLSSKKSD